MSATWTFQTISADRPLTEFVSVDQAVSALHEAIELLQTEHAGQRVRVRVEIQSQTPSSPAREEAVKQVAALLRTRSMRYSTQPFDPVTTAEAIVTKLESLRSGAQT